MMNGEARTNDAVEGSYTKFNNQHDGGRDPTFFKPIEGNECEKTVVQKDFRTTPTMTPRQG